MRKPSRPLLLVLALILLYGFYFSAYSIQRHRAFWTHASDLGQTDQAIWNTLHGNWLETTRRDGTQLPRLADHVEPIFVPVSLVFLLYDGVEALLVLQSFAIGLGALAIFWIARRRFREAEIEPADWLAVPFAALYLLFPALQAANLAEFHAVALAPAPLLFAYHYGTERRWGWFAFFAILALMTQEVISLLVFMLGAYFALRAGVQKGGEAGSLRPTGRSLLSPLRSAVRDPWTFLRSLPRVPLIITLLAALWFGMTVFVIIPAFSPRGASPYTCRYVVSEDCLEVVRGLFLGERLGYVAGLLASVGFLALLDPLALLLGLPALALNVVSNYPAQYSGAYHYSASVAPYFVLAAVGGTAWLLRWRRQTADGRPRAPGRRLAPAILLVAFAIALGYQVLAGYTPASGAFAWPEVTAHMQRLERFVRQVPPDAVLATTPTLHPHVSHRHFLYRYPTVGNAEYILLDVSESVRANPIDFRLAYLGLVDGGYGIQDASDGYILLRRGPGRLAQLPDEFFSLFRAQNAPQVPGQVDFGEAVRFLGYDVLNDPYGRVSLRLYWQALKPLGHNYVLAPFFLDEAGAPQTATEVPALTLVFWYPSASWKPGETVVGETLPLEVGPRAGIGLGVGLGASWAEAKEHLTPQVRTPSPWQVRENGAWVQLGNVEKARGKYVNAPAPR